MLLFIGKDTFKVADESESMVLKSAGTMWRQFKSNLTSDHVKPYIGQKEEIDEAAKAIHVCWKRGLEKICCTKDQHRVAGIKSN